LVNRIEIAAGLYPILAAAIAMSIFAGANVAGASGFLAVYLAGFVLGNRPHRAQLAIGRFHDGFAWLAQIVMFLLLGLLVTPSALVRDTWMPVLIAFSLIFLARPVAVWLSLLPFRFNWREQAFVGWVGLRGAVPIFLASIPVLAGVPEAKAYFNAAFVAVLASLVVQGWTVSGAARLLGLEVLPLPEAVDSSEIELPSTIDREIAGWRVTDGSAAAARPLGELTLPRRTRILAVIRDGTVMDRAKLVQLAPGDYVIALAPPQHLMTLQRLLSPPPSRGPLEPLGLGQFVFDAEARVGAVADQYGLKVAADQRGTTLGDFLAAHLPAPVVVGDRFRLGEAELVVRETERDEIRKVGLELAPEAERLPLLRLWRRLIGAGAGR
ncbi:MAG: potassium/proton antiporter, partial [Alphaproteobacteria bacterium]